MSSLSGNKNAHHERPFRGMKKKFPRPSVILLPLPLKNPAKLLSRLGFLGAIGWAIMVPTLVALALGLWIDTMFPGPLSWGSVMLPLGLFLGCMNAGYWFSQDFTPKDQ
ncbi:AtpZ/AtpI family protein [Vampirovibrio sp.]|uniref:AtpZ/AtpI family protein n=1 Tax=Vampirovibrio sp. TaxID=2717857 RepID=UPI003593FDF7